MKRASTLLLVFFVMLSRGTSASLAPAQEYIFTDLGSIPECSESAAVAINSRGQVVVQANNRQRSFVWTPDEVNGTVGKFWDVGLIEPDYVDPEWGTETTAFDINDKGDVVGVSGSGWHYKGARSSLPFRTRVGKKLDKSCVINTEIGTVPYAINNRGIMVGEYQGASSSHAVKWSSDRQGVSLGKLPQDANVSFTSCSARGINDRGTIVGRSEGHAWVLTGMRKRDIGEGMANAVNNHGVIAGMSQQRACIWVASKRRFLDKAHYRSDIGYDEMNGPGYSMAEDINDSGQAVGHMSVYRPANSDLASGYEARAALWSAGKPVDLSDIPGIPEGWALVSAKAINNKGQIVGYARFEGDWMSRRAFLLTPIGATPEVRAR